MFRTLLILSMVPELFTALFALALLKEVASSKPLKPVSYAAWNRMLWEEGPQPKNHGHHGHGGQAKGHSLSNRH